MTTLSGATRLIREMLAVFRYATTRSALTWFFALLRSLPAVLRDQSLRTADAGWYRRGAGFRTPSGVRVTLPGPYTPGAREMYCRNVYLRTGLSMPTTGWVLDLGANRGLFSVWAACSGAQAVAVEAQQEYAHEIVALARANGVDDRVHVETALAAGDVQTAPQVGVLADDARWESASHSRGSRPPSVSLDSLMQKYDIHRVAMLKVDIEGGEFSVFNQEDDLSWLASVDQIALEVHPDFGDVGPLVELLDRHGFLVELHDNEGRSVTAQDNTVNYAYASRR